MSRIGVERFGIWFLISSFGKVQQFSRGQLIAFTNFRQLKLLRENGGLLLDFLAVSSFWSSSQNNRWRHIVAPLLFGVSPLSFLFFSFSSRNRLMTAGTNDFSSSLSCFLEPFRMSRSEF